MWSCCRRLWYSKIPIISGWSEEYIIDDSYVWIETINYNTVDTHILKYKLSNRFEITSYEECMKIVFDTPKKPWIWIGDQYDMSSKLEPYIVSGNHVTLGLLKALFPYVQEWKYCCPKTLDLLDFPSEGIIINDTNSKTTKKED
jgi:hypothetical protein